MDVVRTSVVRPNLRYDVEFLDNEEEKLRETVAHARTHEGSGIVYARSREKCEQIAKLLYRNGVKARHYHARLESAERADVQERFLKGDVRAIVATTAFGMGIDKPDVRWVLLYNFPSSLEDYVQRVGRAGRDGRPSTCTLFVSDTDTGSLRRFAVGDLPTVDMLRNVYGVIRGRPGLEVSELTPEELRDSAGLAETADPRVLIGMLERTGMIAREFDVGRAMRIRLLPAPADAPRRIEKLLARYADGAQERARRMIAFADSWKCRHLQVAEHFGEAVEVPCGHCDVCAPKPTSRSVGPRKPLPENIGRAIIKAVDDLDWPLGVAGLTATLTRVVTSSNSRMTRAIACFESPVDTGCRPFTRRRRHRGRVHRTVC